MSVVRDVKHYWSVVVLGLAVLILAACSKHEDAAKAATESMEAAASAAKVSCHPQLQKLMDVLPAKAEIEGQQITGRDCRSGMASVTYGNGEPLLVSFELTALQYAETDLEPLGARGGQDVLDNLRKTMETRIVVNESLLKAAAASAASDAVDALKPGEHQQLPREITLPNGAKAMISTQDGNDWELDSVMSERHMLVMHWLNNNKNSRPTTTDEAEAAFTRLVKEVRFDRLR